VARRTEEFYCDKSGGGCGKYFLTFLRESMFGNYSIQCPNEVCNHIHYRVIEMGVVTGDRHQERMGGQVDLIIGLKSTLSDTPKTDLDSFRRKQILDYAK